MLLCYKGSYTEWSFETFGSNRLRLLLSALFCGAEWYCAVVHSSSWLLCRVFLSLRYLLLKRTNIQE